MRIVAISDTHNKHYRIRDLPAGDLLIHAGDMSNSGTLNELNDFLGRFSTQAQNYNQAILIAGNHDWLFYTHPTAARALVPKNVVYLEDSGITYAGFNIWGSPVVPAFGHWAFNKTRGAEINQHWSLIPTSTDLLITHTPARGYLDSLPNGARVGCEDLTLTLNRVEPQLHIFGHIHQSAGVVDRHLDSGAICTFVNACQLNDLHRVVHRPVVLDFNL